MKNTVKSNFVFHSQADTPAIGHIYQSRFQPLIMNIEIFGSATEFELAFEGISSINWQELIGINLTTLDYSTTVNAVGLWQVQLIGISDFRVNLKSLSGGEVSVKGKAVG